MMLQEEQKALEGPSPGDPIGCSGGPFTCNRPHLQSREAHTVCLIKTCSNDSSDVR